MSATLAGAPGDCCRKTVQHDGEARGKVETIAGVETYVARPADGSNKKVILFFADVYGALYINAELIMDYWADNGYLVLGLDYFEGDSMQKHPDRDQFDFPGWVKAKQERAAVLIPPWVEAIKKDYGGEETQYFCVGYCFGAPYVMEHLNTDWIRAGAFGHPAFLNEDHFRNIKQPLLLSCSEIDHTFPVESRRRAEDILVEGKKTYFIQVFGSVAHGFALRGDPKVPIARWSKEESARSILNWFTHFSD
ncbi:alpha/beta-hydrolase [Polyporus arcularius HHB13444]|uniref:Alpha/beta-hydrolase n=1 Tax=Polyporus arcularius HHB13444 TaxID=1314778 RepID=A0A5C3PN23_9APHY|nr:alpha/beta-hydrolase [Polyporus arcularius HHB13444]